MVADSSSHIPPLFIIPQLLKGIIALFVKQILGVSNGLAHELIAEFLVQPLF